MSHPQEDVFDLTFTNKKTLIEEVWEFNVQSHNWHIILNLHTHTHTHTHNHFEVPFKLC